MRCRQAPPEIFATTVTLIRPGRCREGEHSSMCSRAGWRCRSPSSMRSRQGRQPATQRKRPRRRAGPTGSPRRSRSLGGGGSFSQTQTQRTSLRTEPKHRRRCWREQSPYGASRPRPYRSGRRSRRAIARGLVHDYLGGSHRRFDASLPLRQGQGRSPQPCAPGGDLAVGGQRARRRADLPVRLLVLIEPDDARELREAARDVVVGRPDPGRLVAAEFGRGGLGDDDRLAGAMAWIWS